MLDRESESLTDKLIQDLSGVRERISRTVLLGEKLRTLDDGLALEVMHVICVKSSRRIQEYEEILLSLVDVPRLARIVGQAKMSSLYIRAQGMGYDDVVRILSRPVAARRRGEDEDNAPFDPELIYVPLGVRKSLARGQQKKYLDRLLLDQDPSVIANLLLNPRLTEKEVLKIASRRPCHPKVLVMVYENRKWILRYAVKKALVRNPYTPPEISLRLLGFIHSPDLLEISSDDTLHPDVTAAAKKLLDVIGG